MHPGNNCCVISDLAEQNLEHIYNVLGEMVCIDNVFNFKCMVIVDID